MNQRFATTLSDKEVMDSNGRHIGKFDTVQFHSQTGDLQRLLVTKTDRTKHELAHEYDKDQRGRFIVPTHLVQSVDDCIIIAADA